MDSPGPAKQGRFRVGKLQRFKLGSTDQLVAENVTHGSDGVFRCAIAGPGSCPFALPKMIQFTFACHFLRSHPKEAQEKGFLEQPEEAPTKSSQPVALGKLVIRTERGFCCRIDPSQTCAYVQEDQVCVQSFTHHFRQTHPILARKYGFYKVLQSNEGRSILKSMIQQSVENSTAEPSSKKRKPAEDDYSEESSSDAIILNPSDENEWLNAPSDKPSEYCRLCFSVARASKPIFSGPEDAGSSCAALIEECTGVRLTAEEDYPAAICHECSAKLHDIKCFRMQCETLNRVVCRNRATLQEKTPEVVAEPEPVAFSSSPPPLVPFEEPVGIPIGGDEFTFENDDEDYVAELSDSDEDEVVEGTPEETNSTVATVQETDEDLPYIALQDDWFCCKQCNQIHHTLDGMVDHLHNYHSELGFFAKPKPAEAPQVNKKKYKKNKLKPISTIVDYQEVVVGDKTYFKCNSCDTLLSQKGNMARHERCYHKEGEQRPRLFCKVAGCFQNFMDRMGLTRHLKLQHNYDSLEEMMALQLHNDMEIL